jgi:ribosomal protein S18 acetylase RimI-like enzyme
MCNRGPADEARDYVAVLDGRISELEHSAWSMFSFIGRGPGGRIVDTPTRLVIESPVDRPPYNGVWRFYDEGDRPLRDQVAALLAPMVERGVPPVWAVHPTTDTGVRDELAALGLACAEEIYGMATDLADVPPPGDVPDGVEVVELSLDDSHMWVELVSWRYGLGAESSEYLIEAYRATLGETTRVWVALVDGQPVSKVGLHIDHLVNPDGVAGIYGVATTESGRNRGLARLLCSTALEAARATGVRRTVLHSTPMARSLYQRMGYEDVATFEIWAVPDSLHL